MENLYNWHKNMEESMNKLINDNKPKNYPLNL